MRKIYKHIIAVVLIVGIISGCASSKNKEKQRISFSPYPYQVILDSSSQAKLNLTFHIPKHYFSKRSRLFIVPQLKDSDSIVKVLSPLVLDAPIYSKKMERREKLEHFDDPYANIAQKVATTGKAYEASYQHSFLVPKQVNKGYLIAVASEDGCGQCTGIDTVRIADIYRPIIQRQLHLNWMEPAFVIRPKIMKGKGTAHLQFVINKYDINLAMGNNEQELTHMLNDIAPILKDSLAILNSLDIYGMASADGSLKFNTPLARNRANAAKQWLVNQTSMPVEQQRLIHIGSRPEGWQPVLRAMIADNNADSVAVKAILEKYAAYNDDVQERYIRKLPVWKVIRERYLQKDRQVEYTYSYTIKSFTTDSEMLNLYRKRPDAFNEEELLHVASLMDNTEKKKEVYLTTLKYFPNSKVAVNNLAILLEREGKIEEAEALLKSHK